MGHDRRSFDDFGASRSNISERIIAVIITAVFVRNILLA
jgi:hypothetical protein